MKPLLVLGSTGSIGTQALDVVRANPGAFAVQGLAAASNWQTLLEQACEFQPPFVAIADPDAAAQLAPRLPKCIAAFRGPSAIEELIAAADFHTAVHGIVGAAGVVPSLRVLERGKVLALANKESLVVAGELLMQVARERAATILPVDSELCAIYQCLRGEDPARVRRVLLTASGGPFRDLEPHELSRVTPQTALRHPNWTMGPRITIGSATLMNKALEVIEVHHLFGFSAEQIEVVVHRQSVAHSMVELCDGSVIAQMGPPDMRMPLHFCLHHPHRAPSRAQGFDLRLFRELTFEAPRRELFPALELGFRCVVAGGNAGAVLNAADEVTVAAFLEGSIAFPEIARINARVLGARPRSSDTIEALLEADRWARSATRAEIETVSAL